MRPVILFLAVILFFSCQGGSQTHSGKSTDHTSSVYRAGRFNIEDMDGYKKLTITDPWQNSAGEELTYYLAREYTLLPETIPADLIIRVPVKRMVCMSTTHLAMMIALDATDIIVGASGTRLIYDPGLREAVTRGKVADVGYEANLDKELIVSLRPDLLMAYGVGASSSEYLRKLSDMGVKIMFNADYLEEHPLARCEWIKVFGILTGKEDMADSIWNTVRDSYMKLVDEVNLSSVLRPDILLGAPWEDVWYISPSNSYIGCLINDAGGRYLFDDLLAPNSMPYSVEAVFKRAIEADVWINPGTAESLSDIGVSDHRLTKLQVFRSGNVWNNRLRMTNDGGNDYWESAVVRPDRLLGDFISILHPEIMPDRLPYYYKKLE
jgi:iron complex transport system substrate-binding protein